MTSADLVYQILKVIEQEKEPGFNALGVDKKDFHAVLEQIDDAGYATNISFSRGGRGNEILIAYATGSRLTAAGRNFIADYESRVK
ncbi:hypothetical protein [Paenibacillus phytohabitans]|uniref:hypothetical protein n=1 Tax=Paenibacillus phytohabitans TaxID=2654978 RepID=UPI0030082B6C